MKTVLATLLIGLLASQQASLPAATVASAAGSWQAAGGALTRGKAVTVGEMLTATAPGGLLLDCPNELVAYSCRGNDCGTQACEQKSIGQVRRTVIRSKAQAPAARGWMDALFRREPREPIVAVARAGGNPVDAVLLAEGRGVQWGPALMRVLEGRHCFRLTSLPANPGARSVSFTLDWDRTLDATAVQSVPGLASGLYLLEKGPASAGACQPDADGVPSWVLISAANSFAQLNATWQAENEALTKLETEDVDVASIRAMRHAVLAALADQAR